LDAISFGVARTIGLPGGHRYGQRMGCKKKRKLTAILNAEVVSYSGLITYEDLTMSECLFLAYCGSH
jgi:hypothetical protein